MLPRRLKCTLRGRPFILRNYLEWLRKSSFHGADRRLLHFLRQRLGRFVARNPPHGIATRLACVSRLQQSFRRRRLENACTYVAAPPRGVETRCATKGRHEQEIFPASRKFFVSPGKFVRLPAALYISSFSTSSTLTSHYFAVLNCYVPFIRC